MKLIDIMMNVIQLESVEVLIKLVLIYILSGFIGLERANLNKPAGFRTHVLVGMSAVLTVICAEKLANISGSTDYSRIPAQLLSGIGFLGAGTILRDGFNVKGLTTAASLLAVTCIGLCIGAGLYVTGIISTTVVYIVLRNTSARIAHFNNIHLRIETYLPKEVMPSIQDILDRNKIEVQKMELEKNESNDKQFINVVGRHRDEINKNKLLTDLLVINNVNEVLEILENVD